jgi:hypothetical protein
MEKELVWTTFGGSVDLFTSVKSLAGLGSMASDSRAFLLIEESVSAFRLPEIIFVVALRFAVAPAEVRGTVFDGR